MIDTHAHLFFDELLGTVPNFGPTVRSADGGWELSVGAYRWPLRSPRLSVDPAVRIGDMDEAGISIQVVSLSPLWLFPTIEPSTAVSFHRHANQALRAWCEAAPDRLLPVASLPTQQVHAAVRELTTAHEEGFVGGYLAANARSGLDHADLDALYDAAEALDMPLFVHSTMPGLEQPGDPRLDRWMGGVVLGYPFEETLAVASLVFGGVFDRHPRLDIVVSHGGGTFPLLHGRMREFSGLDRSPIDTAAFDRAVSRLWLDTHTHSPEGLIALRRILDDGRLVYGSNFGGWDTGGGHEMAGIADELDANARTLLRLKA